MIKEPAQAKAHGKLSASEQLTKAKAWAPVLQWEIDTGEPRLLVAMGERVAGYLNHLCDRKLLRVPRIVPIWHYTFVFTFKHGEPPWIDTYNAQLQGVGDQLAELKARGSGKDEHEGSTR